MSQQETAKEEFDRLRNEMQLGRPLYMMSREEAESKPDDWFYFRTRGRDTFMAMINARERMECEMPGRNSNHAHGSGKHHGMHPLWERSNEKLRAGMDGGNYGQL